MSGAFDHQPHFNNANNSTGIRVSTWKHERQSVTEFAHLSPESMQEFLKMIGYLFGIRVDCNSGPKRTTSPVAFLKAGGRACFSEETEVDTESIATHNEREANYARRGWSLNSLSLDLPWIRSRIANNNQPNQPEESITKRVLGCQLHIDIQLEDLSPAPEFEAAIKDAVGNSTPFEKFRAIYRVFDRWGDVIPLSFDVGTSLTATDSKSNHDAVRDLLPLFNNPIHLSSLEPSKLIDHKTAKILVQGIDLTIPSNGDRSWIYGSKVPIGRWSQIRVTKAIPVTELLSAELQVQLSQLHSSLVSYFPLSLEGVTGNGYAFDDMPHALKTIKSVTTHCTDRVNSLSVAYVDGSVSPRYGTKKGHGSTFNLEFGEHISEVHLWEDSNGPCSIQFLTTAERASQVYGGSGGMPRIISNTGGLLAAFAGKVRSDSIYQIQASALPGRHGIWRHDIKPVDASRKRQYSGYHGGAGGCRFSDIPVLKDPKSTISRIKVRSASLIDGIQITYAYREEGRVISVEGPHHGGHGGTERVFELKAEEYITMVRGRAADLIDQISFTTNLGRSSPVFGGGGGREFVCKAPLSKDGRAMRLYSICGNCAALVDGLVFVWVIV